MTGSYPAILESLESALAVGFWVFLRIGAAMAFFPAIGEASVPVRVRLGVALALTMVVSPAVFGAVPAGTADGAAVPLTILSEVVAGLIIGLALRLFVVALQVAAAIAAQSTSLSQVFGGAGVEPQPAFGYLLVVASLALFVTLKLHVVLAAYIIHSYQLFEPGRLLAGEVIASLGVREVARSFSLAFSLAAPFLIASLIYNIAIGAINRAMPQLMVSFVGAPALTAGGLVLLFLASPLMLGVWMSALEEFLLQPFRAWP